LYREDTSSLREFFRRGLGRFDRPRGDLLIGFCLLQIG
jgi:hypothetical protein